MPGGMKYCMKQLPEGNETKLRENEVTAVNK